MPTLVQTTAGRVVSIIGKAMVRGADGKMRPLNVGDYLKRGDVVLTTQDGIIELNPDAPVIAKKGDLDDINTAGGVAGGSLGEGLRVGRIGEGTTSTVIGSGPAVDQSRIAAAERDPNQPPVAVDGAVSGNEDTLIPVSLTGRDIDGTVAGYTVVRVPTGGVLYVGGATAASKAAQAGGTTGKLAVPGQPIAEGTQLTPEEAANLVFQPAPNFNGNPGDVVFTVTDNDGAVSAPATVTISIAAVNDAPVPGTVPLGPDGTPLPDPSPNHIPSSPNYRYATDEDVPVSGRVRATDVDNDTLTYTRSSEPISGSVVVNPDGTFVYTPNRDFNGSDSFVVLVDDGKGGTATSTVFVTVNPVPDNNPPVIEDDPTRPGDNRIPTTNDYALATRAETPVSGQVLASDPDGDPLKYSLNTQPANGTVVFNADGTYTYTPAKGFDGADSFKVLIDDGRGGLVTSTIQITVTPNNPPVIEDDPTRDGENRIPSTNDYALVTDEDTAVTGQVVATDPDGDKLSYTLVGQPANGALAFNPDGSYTYTPSKDFNGTDAFQVLIDDGRGGQVTSTIKITVNPVNDPPVVEDDPSRPGENRIPATNDYALVTDEDTAVSGQVLATDPDGDKLSYTLVGQPANGALTFNPDGTYSYTPAKDFNGTDAFQVLIDDGRGGQVTSTIKITVNPVNDPPVVEDDPSRPGENRLPSTNDYALVTDEDKAVTGQVLATDPDGDKLTYTLVGQPANGALAFNPDGSYTYTPAKDFNGADAFQVLIDDGKGGQVTSTIKITVNPVNDPPVVEDDPSRPGENRIPTTSDYALTTPEDTAVSGQVLASDVDGDKLTYTLVGQPANGALTFNPDGTYVYTPAKDFNGTDAFQVLIDDGKDGRVTSTVQILVTPTPDAPTGADTVRTLNEDGTYVLQADDFGFKDPDPGDTLAGVRIDALPARGSLTLNGVAVAAGQVISVADVMAGRLVFAPVPDENGVGYATFRFSVQDSTGLFDASPNTFGFNVNALPDTPVLVDDSVRTDEDKAVLIDVLANDRDADAGDKLTIIAVNGQAIVEGGAAVSVTSGSVKLVGGKLEFTPSMDANTGDPSTPVSFTYTATDGMTPLTATVKVDITPVNDAPVAANDSVTVAQGQSREILVLANDSDVDGDALKVASFTQPATGGTVSLSADGTRLIFTANMDFTGSVSFQYVATDGNGGLSAPATVTVTASDVNFAPVANPDVATTDEDVAVRINVLANDRDPDGDTLLITKVAGQAIAINGTVTILDAAGVVAGTVKLLPDMQLEFTPALNYNTGGSDNPKPVVFGYEVTDGTNPPQSAQVSLTINPINDAPVALDVSLQGTENTALVIDLVARQLISDPEGDPLTVTRVAGQAIAAGQSVAILDPVSGAKVGSVMLDGPTKLVFTPEPGVNGPLPAFDYEVSDGKLSDAGTIRLALTNVNEAPVAFDDGPSPSLTFPDTTGTVTFDPRSNDSDPENDPLTIVAINGQAIAVGTPVVIAGKGVVQLNADGTLSFTPASGVSGEVALTYQVSDGQLLSNTANIVLTITPVNDAPSGADGSRTINEDSTYALVLGDFGFSDPDVGDALAAVRIDRLPAAGTLMLDGVQVSAGAVITASAIEAGRLTFRPAQDAVGAPYADFAFSVQDKAGAFDPTPNTFTFNVTPLPDAPLGADATREIKEDTPYIVQAADFGFSDVDQGNTLAAVRIDALPARGTLTLAGVAVQAGQVVSVADINAGKLVFTPALNENGLAYANFLFSVQDNTGLFDTVPNAFKFDVTAVDDPTRIIQISGAPVQEAALLGAASTASSGTIRVEDPDTVITSFKLAPPTQPLTSGGLAVTWTLGADGKSLTGTVTTGAGQTQTVATLVISDDPATFGQYQFTLLRPLDHPAPPAGTLSDANALNLGFVVDTVPSAGLGMSPPANLSITVVDSAPVAQPNTDPFEVGRVDSNLLLVLDMSTSMRDLVSDPRTPGATITRFDLAVRSLNELLDGYAVRGEVRVQVVAFGTNASALGLLGTWYDVDTAKALLAQIQLKNEVGTNYDEALADAIRAYDLSGKLTGPGVVNAAYFLSDGKPTYGSGGEGRLFDPADTNPNPAPIGDGIATTGPDVGIDAGEKAQWEAFLKANNIQAFAIGLDSTDTRPALDPIAYDGRTTTPDAARDTLGLDTSSSKLADLLTSTLPAAQGRLISRAFEKAGTVQSADGVQLTVLMLNDSGVTKTYVINQDRSGVFGLDADDSFTGRTLTLRTTAGGVYTIDIDTTQYTYQGPGGSTLPAPGTDSLAFTLQDGDGDRTTSSVSPLFTAIEDTRTEVLVSGTAPNQQFIGTFQSETINGGDGNDMISGRGGNDVLIGGQGSDLLVGGVGADVFKWQLGDGGTSAFDAAQPAGGGGLVGGVIGPIFNPQQPGQVSIPQDVIGDFDMRPVANGGDVLDLRDLLVGETQGSLEKYLDFEFNGKDTVIRISTKGQFDPNPGFDTFTPGDTSANGYRTDQVITLTGVRLDTALNLGQNASDAAIISELLKQGKLITD